MQQKLWRYTLITSHMKPNIQKDTKPERFWVLVLCRKWKILYLASGSPSTKVHQRHWMNDLQEVWVGQNTSEFCAYDSFYLYLCVFTHIHAGTLGGQQRASDPPELELWGLWTSWGRWELNTPGLTQEQQVLLTSATYHCPSFELKLGCHPQAVSLMCMAIF